MEWKMKEWCLIVGQNFRKFMVERFQLGNFVRVGGLRFGPTAFGL